MHSVQARRSNVPLLTFGLLLACVYCAAFAIVSRLTQIERADLIAGALTVDLTLLVPGLYYLLLVRWRGWPAITILPVFIISVALATWLIPDSQHQVLDLVSYAAAVAELTIVVIVLRKLLQVRRSYRQRSAAGLDVPTALRESASAVLGPVAGGALAYEVTLFYYAVTGWRRAPDSPPEGSFTYHRTSGYVALAFAVLMALVIETVAVHFLLRLWSPVAAWILTAISIYSAIWIIGDTQAVRSRPFVLSGGTLHVRLGLRWNLDIPLERIEKITAVTDGALPLRAPAYLKALLLGGPNRRLELDEPARALGPYGLSRQVKIVDLQLDEPDRFDAALKQAGCNGL